jgi:hypothetical protein
MRFEYYLTNVPRAGVVPLDCDARTTHTVPLGTSGEQYERVGIVYVSYWTMLKDGSPYKHVRGPGRPFWPVCVNVECGRALKTVPAIVGVECDRHNAGTAVLGWCACVCCINCIISMPLLEGGWRACPCCRSAGAHQDDWLMYPLTEEGREYNVHLEREYTTELRKIRDGSEKR